MTVAEVDLWKVDYEVFEHFMLRLADVKKNSSIDNSRASSKEDETSPMSKTLSPIKRVSSLVKKKKKKKISKTISVDPSMVQTETNTMSRVSLLTNEESKSLEKRISNLTV